MRPAAAWMGPRAQARSLDYEENHRHELEDAAGEYPQVKHAVKIAHVFGDIERHARGVAHAADGEQGKCHGVEQRHKFRQLKDNEPAHQQIDQAAYPMRLALAQEALEGDADDGDGPYGKEQHSAAVVCERDEANGV